MCIFEHISRKVCISLSLGRTIFILLIICDLVWTSHITGIKIILRVVDKTVMHSDSVPFTYHVGKQLMLLLRSYKKTRLSSDEIRFSIIQ